MKTPAIIASLTVVGSIAYAAGSQGTAGKQSPVMPRGTQAHSMQEDMPQAQNQNKSVASDCAPIEDKVWFAPTPLIVPCTNNGSLEAQPSNLADVNGDSTFEYLRDPQTGWGGWWVIYNNEPSTEVAQSAVFTETIDKYGLKLWRIPLLDARIYAWCEDNLPPTLYGFRRIGLRGWRDMDSDGDLDLILYAADLNPNGGALSTQVLWLENIGYEKPAPPIAADINRDGRVDGADLGLVLVSWGPNP
jgi:hypothetical protein